MLELTYFTFETATNNEICKYVIKSEGKRGRNRLNILLEGKETSQEMAAWCGNKRHWPVEGSKSPTNFLA